MCAVLESDLSDVQPGHPVSHLLWLGGADQQQPASAYVTRRHASRVPKKHSDLAIYGALLCAPLATVLTFAICGTCDIWKCLTVFDSCNR